MDTGGALPRSRARGGVREDRRGAPPAAAALARRASAARGWCRAPPPALRRGGRHSTRSRMRRARRRGRHPRAGLRSGRCPLPEPLSPERPADSGAPPASPRRRSGRASSTRGARREAADVLDAFAQSPALPRRGRPPRSSAPRGPSSSSSAVTSIQVSKRLRVVLAASGLSLPRNRLVAPRAPRAGASSDSRLRALAWTAWRRGDEVEPSATARIDLWLVGQRGRLGLIDSLRSILFFVDIGALLALDHGDGRLARAAPAATAAGAGRRGGAAARLGGRASVRHRARGPIARSLLRRARRRSPTVSFLENDWRGCLEGMREARRLSAESAVARRGGRVDHRRSVRVLVRFENLGRVPGAARAASPRRSAARSAPGTGFIEVNFRTQFVNLTSSTTARTTPGATFSTPSPRGPASTASSATRTTSRSQPHQYVAIYEGDVGGGDQRQLVPEWKRYFASLLSRVVFLRQDALFWTGACALVLARVASGRERARRLRAARRALRELERIDLPMAAAYALQLAANRTAMTSGATPERGRRAPRRTDRAHTARIQGGPRAAGATEARGARSGAGRRRWR